MINDNKISVIIPTYNYGHLIGQTLDSILQQSYANWEVIIVDDESKDGTELIVKPYLEKDHRFQYIKQKNKGVSSARNNGLEKATGEYIQFLDADDLLSGDKLKNQIAFLKANPSVDIVLSDTRYFESNDFIRQYTDLDLKNKTTSTRLEGKGFPVLSQLVERNQMVIQSPLFRTEILKSIGLFKTNMTHLEDWDFWLRCAFHNYTFGFLDDDKTMSFVRVHPISASKHIEKLFEAEAMLRRNFEGYLKNSTFLTTHEKRELYKLNTKLLIKTFKILMAKTSFFNLKKWHFFFKALGLPIFYTSFIKAMNIKRKSI